MAIALVISGNLWLLAALILTVGRHVARTQPTMYSFFETGGWWDPDTYHLWIGLCLAAAIVNLILAYMSRNRVPPDQPRTRP